MFFNSSVSGPPGIRSTLTTFVCPTRAHSDMICRSVASLAITETLPSCIVTCTSAKAGAPASSTAALAVAKIPHFMAPTILLLSEVVDHLNEDVVQAVLWRVANQSFRLGQRRHAARHVLEP